MKTAIVTGGNGFIGARVVAALLHRGWHVHAVGRATAQSDWPARLHAALDDIDGSPFRMPANARLSCRHLQLTDAAACRRAMADAAPAPDSRALLFHVAGDTSFTPRDPAVQRAANVDGTLNIIRACAAVAGRVVHVSTAYVCGLRNNRVLETDAERGQTFRNSYEASKMAAETAVTQLCRCLGLPLIVLRPSIITNDTRTGRSSAFTHLNAVAEVVKRLQHYYGINAGETVSRQIRVVVAAAGRPNLAPVDPIVHAAVTIALHPDAAGAAYHLCHPAPPENSELFDRLLEAFEVKGKVALRFVDRLEPPLTPTEKMISRALKVYVPYLNDRAVFDLSNTRRIAPEYDRWFPPLTRAYLRRVIAFQHARSASPAASSAGTAPTRHQPPAPAAGKPRSSP